MEVHRDRSSRFEKEKSGQLTHFRFLAGLQEINKLGFYPKPFDYFIMRTRRLQSRPMLKAALDSWRGPLQPWKYR
jgi:hypothetical protein